MSDDGSVKDLALGLAGAAAAVIAAPTLAIAVPGAVAAAALGLIGAGFEKMRMRDTKRVKAIFEQLLEADPDPAAFDADLQKRLADEDEVVIGALRAMLTGALDAVSPETLVVMARLTRRHLRAACPVWIARGGLRVLAELSTEELEAFREIMRYASVRRMAGAPGNVVFNYRVTDGARVPALLLGGDLVAHGHGDRFMDLLPRHGLTRSVQVTNGHLSYLTPGDHLYLADEVVEHLAPALPRTRDVDAGPVAR